MIKIIKIIKWMMVNQIYITTIIILIQTTINTTTKIVKEKVQGVIRIME